MDTKEKLVDVLTREIGYFARSKTGTVAIATSIVESWKITGVEYTEDGIVHIKTCRPGLIFGRHGENIDALVKFLQQNKRGIKVSFVNIVEDKATNAFNDNLFNFQYEDYMRGNI